MDINLVVDQLHSLERIVIPVLKTESELYHIVAKSGLTETEVSRVLQWLENKKVLTRNKSESEIVKLDELGRKYIKDSLPERRLIKQLKDKNLKLDQIKNLDKQEISACLGNLKKKGIIDIIKGNEILIKLTETGKKYLTKNFPEEDFLKRLDNTSIPVKSLYELDRFAFDSLKIRGNIIKVETVKDIKIELTDLGKELVNMKIGTDIIESITPEIIREELWKTKKIRAYDIKTSVPKIYCGRRHFVNKKINQMKKVWLDLGFTEMKGNHIDTAFWDMDALFTPQDHPAREMQDTFYLGKNKKVELGEIRNNQVKEKVKKVHENGWDTGSTGWKYKWKEEEAKKLLLRTHTTVLSSKTLSELKHFPAKFFAIGKVYRNEALDWKHLFEFYQVEGIVVDENANFKHLIGYLKEFYSKMGLKVRIRPGFFAYVEPGCEIEIFNEEKKEWVEVGGAGIFRPEVVKPLLGKEIPVLAWGQGLERGIVEYFKIKDLRDIYKNDLKMLREIKEVM